MNLVLTDTTYEMFSFWGYMKLNKYEIKNYKESSCNGFSKELFTEMRKIGFSNHIVETKVDFTKWNEIAYGNYNLKEIEYNDFVGMSIQQIREDIDYYLLNVGEDKTLHKGNRNFLINIFNQKFYRLIPANSFCVKFKPVLSVLNKKLSWGGQFSHFQSYIFVTFDCKEVFYLEFGYD